MHDASRINLMENFNKMNMRDKIGADYDPQGEEQDNELRRFGFDPDSPGQLPFPRAPVLKHFQRQAYFRHKAVALLEMIQRSPKSVKCNTHHTIIVDVDVMREIDSLLLENGHA